MERIQSSDQLLCGGGLVVGVSRAATHNTKSYQDGEERVI